MILFSKAAPQSNRGEAFFGVMRSPSSRPIGPDRTASRQLAAEKRLLADHLACLVSDHQPLLRRYSFVARKVARDCAGLLTGCIVVRELLPFGVECTEPRRWKK